MPHAVLLGATLCPPFGREPILREGDTIHRVVDVATLPEGWLLKSIVIAGGKTTKFLARIDRRKDGLLVRLDDHVPVERTPEVEDHLAAIARRVLAANPGARVGPTNLAERIRGPEAPNPADVSPVP